MAEDNKYTYDDDRQIILFEFNLLDYERSYGLEGHIPSTLPEFDTKDMMIQRLIANVRILKEMLNRTIQRSK